MLSLLFRGVLHSNPMDYAWGANGLDAIITQVKLGFTRVSILLYSAAAPVAMQGTRDCGGTNGKASAMRGPSALAQETSGFCVLLSSPLSSACLAGCFSSY